MLIRSIFSCLCVKPELQTSIKHFSSLIKHVAPISNSKLLIFHLESKIFPCRNKPYLNFYLNKPNRKKLFATKYKCTLIYISERKKNRSSYFSLVNKVSLNKNGEEKYCIHFSDGNRLINSFDC